MPRYRLRQLLIRFAVAAVLLTVFRFFHSAIRPVYPASVYDRLPVGLSKEGVREVLGEPTKVYDNTWHYQPVSYNPGYVPISFDDNDCLLWVNDESIYRP